MAQVNTNNTNVTGSKHLAIVASSDTPLTTQATSLRRPTIVAGASFGSAVQSTSNRHNTSVRAIAAKYDNFEDALLPMVLASGVTGDAAVAASEAIMNNPALRTQAERAFNHAKLGVVG